MSFLFAFNPDKLKPNLKMSVHRINIKKQKAAAIAAKQKKEIAALLRDGKEEKARIRTEAVIRSDFQVEAYEIIELLCELLSERMNLVTSEKRCPLDLRECISTLIWCANRTEIPEMKEVKTQLVKKYGSEFEKAAMQNLNGCVNERVIVKLNVKPPNAFLVHSYMKEIAIANNIDWSPLEEDMTSLENRVEAMPAPTGFSVEPGGVSQIPQPYQVPMATQVPQNPSTAIPESSSTQPLHNKGVPPDNFGLPQAPTEAQFASVPGVSQMDIGGLPQVPPAGPAVQAYPVAPPQQQQPPTFTQGVPQAPPEMPQVPPAAPGASVDKTSAGLDDLQARLDALQKK